jgi:hypothetical protein
MGSHQSLRGIIAGFIRFAKRGGIPKLLAYNSRWGRIHYGLSTIIGGGLSSAFVWVQNHEHNGVVNDWVKTGQVRRPGQTVLVAESARINVGKPSNPSLYINTFSAKANTTGLYAARQGPFYELFHSQECRAFSNLRLKRTDRAVSGCRGAGPDEPDPQQRF